MKNVRNEVQGAAAMENEIGKWHRIKAHIPAFHSIFFIFFFRLIDEQALAKTMLMAKETTASNTHTFVTKSSFFFFLGVFKVISRVHRNETFFIHFLVCSSLLRVVVQKSVRACVFFLSELQLYAIIIKCTTLKAIYSQRMRMWKKFTINFNCILSVSTNFHENLDHHQLPQQQQQEPEATPTPSM